MTKRYSVPSWNKKMLQAAGYQVAISQSDGDLIGLAFVAQDETVFAMLGLGAEHADLLAQSLTECAAEVRRAEFNIRPGHDG